VATGARAAVGGGVMGAGVGGAITGGVTGEVISIWRSVRGAKVISE
jgi:hypothetical protein